MRSFDPAYNTVDRNDFAAMIDVERYGQRTPHFDEIIARTEEHFWNPDDPDYIDLTTPSPADEPLLPFGLIAELHTAMWPTGSTTRRRSTFSQRVARAGRSPTSCTASKAR